MVPVTAVADVVKEPVGTELSERDLLALVAWMRRRCGSEWTPGWFGWGLPR